MILFFGAEFTAAYARKYTGKVALWNTQRQLLLKLHRNNVEII
jgi:hypothetical protein